MHILLVSSSIESLPCSKLLQHLNDVTIYEVTTVEKLPNENIPLDLIFFDAELGAENINQQIHLYHQQNKPTQWLVSNLTNIQQSLQYLQAGASGILANPCCKETLQNCLQSITKNQLYLENDLIQILAWRQIKKLLQPFNQLTAREFDVFCLLAESYSIQRIAQLLSITAKTAFNCQTQLRKKLGLKNQQEITQFAKKHNLVG